MLSDDALLAAYAKGFTTSHITGLQAVQSAVVASIPQPTEPTEPTEPT